MRENKKRKPRQTTGGRSPLKVMRILKGLTQEDLSAALGCSQSLYSHIERTLKDPGPALRKKIMHELGADVFVGPERDA